MRKRSMMGVEGPLKVLVTTTYRQWIKTELRQVKPKEPLLSAKAPFVRFDLADRMLGGNNHKRKRHSYKLIDIWIKSKATE